MFKSPCAHCSSMLKGKEINVTTFDAYISGVKYKDYAVTCSKCGGTIVWDRYAQKSAENKAKAAKKAATKKGKSVKQITEEERYMIIMRKVGKRAKEIADARNVSPAKVQDLNAAVNELPDNEKSFVLAYEEKQDMAILKNGHYKTHDKATPQCILLMTQAIIASAIEEKDEDFFEHEYGKHVVDTYNAALTVHKGTDYGITAELLLEKMRKGKLAVNQEEESEDV